jgi:hypothetical protein
MVKAFGMQLLLKLLVTREHLEKRQLLTLQHREE